MTYTPDPTNATQPDPTLVAAGTAAIEFQALKLYLKQILTAGESRNLLINAAMNIDQLNQGTASYNIGGGIAGFTLDQWVLLNVGTGNIVVSQQPGGPDIYSNCLEIVHDSNSPTSYLLQYVESIFCEKLTEGTVVTVSGQIFIDNNSGVTIEPYFVGPNARDTYTSGETTFPAVGTPIATTNGVFVYFEQQVTLTAACIQGIGFGIANNAVSGRTIKVTQLQLEVNDFATPFEYRLPQTDLVLCQRYYYVAGITDQSYASAAAQVIYRSVNLPVNMRLSDPTVTIGQVEYTANSSNGSVALYTVNNTQVILAGVESVAAGMVGWGMLVEASARIV